jgi:polyferredoxin
VLLVMGGVAAGSLAMRNPLKVDVIRDRGALAREAAPGVIENIYRVQIMNTDETSRRFSIRAEGLPGLTVAGVEQPVAVGPAQTRLLPLRLQLVVDVPVDVPARDGRRDADGPLRPGTHRIELIIQSLDDDKVVRHEKSSFIIPR